MRDRTCILVTYYVDMGMDSAALAVLLDKGRVIEQDSASKVLMKALLLYDDASIPVGRTLSFVNSARQQSFNTIYSAPLGVLYTDNYELDSNAISAANTRDLIYVNGRFVDNNETYAEGGISRKVYWAYFSSSGGYTLWTAVIFVYMLYELTFVIQSYWLSVWTDKNSTLEYNSLHFLIYFILILLVLFLIGLPHFLTYLAALRASYNLHENLVISIKQATISFIDKTPIGRIMNRFSADINFIDQDLPTHLFFLISGIGDIVFQLGVIAAALPKFLPIIKLIGKLLYIILILAYSAHLFIGITYVLTIKYYLKASRSIKRIKSISRSLFLVQTAEMLKYVDNISLTLFIKCYRS